MHPCQLSDCNNLGSSDASYSVAFFHVNLFSKKLRLSFKLGKLVACIYDQALYVDVNDHDMHAKSRSAVQA